MLYSKISLCIYSLHWYAKSFEGFGELCYLQNLILSEHMLCQINFAVCTQTILCKMLGTLLQNKRYSLLCRQYLLNCVLFRSRNPLPLINVERALKQAITRLTTPNIDREGEEKCMLSVKPKISVQIMNCAKVNCKRLSEYMSANILQEHRYIWNVKYTFMRF